MYVLESAELVRRGVDLGKLDNVRIERHRRAGIGQGCGLADSARVRRPVHVLVKGECGERDGRRVDRVGERDVDRRTGWVLGAGATIEETNGAPATTKLSRLGGDRLVAGGVRPEASVSPSWG